LTDDIEGLTGRFRLHGSGRTIGCIEIPNTADWEKINNFFKETKNYEVNVKNTHEKYVF